MIMKQLSSLMIMFFLLNHLFAQNVLVPNHLNFEPELSYDVNIPSPDAFLGYQVGEDFAFYAQVVDYFNRLDELSKKIVVKNYGKTHEGRPLIYAVITSEANHQRLEEIRLNNLKLTDPVNTGLVEAQALMKTQPIIISMSYNIHGNEPSATESAIQVAYRLVAAQDQATQQLLDNMVFVMYPCLNPDGRDRYTYWYKSVRRGIPALEPNDLDHQEPWPQGRTNHYWFDLNRDWVWGVHPESRGHVAIYQQWMPQLHTDVHEMGYNNNYFTAPGTTPRNLLLPDTYEPLSDTIGRANIAAFNKYKIDYYTRESFDFFYPSYGSSYPSVLGAIGMLVEQGGIGGGRVIQTDDGTLLTFRQRVFDQYLTCIATIQKGVQQKALFMQYSYDALNPKNSKSKTKAYFLPDDGSGYLYDMLNVLNRQGVKIERTKAALNAANIVSYKSGKAETKQLPAGTFVVSTNQNRHLLINSIMSRTLAIEDSVMYDMSTWSAPLAYNLEAYYTEQSLALNMEVVNKIPEVPYGVENPDAQYAFIINWTQRNAPKALAMLWEKGYRVRAAQEPFTMDKQTFGEGSLTILLGRNREKEATIKADMQAIANTAKVSITGVNTGRVSDGIDAGSRNNVPLTPPKVALMVEPPFDLLASGQIYYLFDQETRLPIERIKTSVLMQTAIPKFGSRYGFADLNDYDVLILPGGGASLAQVFAKDQLEQLKAWVSAGGTLIASESAVNFFTDKDSKMTDVKLSEMKRDSSDAAKYLAYNDRTDFYGKKRIPGSALNAMIDVTHPLAFGMKPSLYTLTFSNSALMPNSNLQTVGYYVKDKANLLASGYASAENLDHLAGKTFAAVQPMGQGKIVFLMNNTQFRMFWIGGMRMMQNAVMLMPSF